MKLHRRVFPRRHGEIIATGNVSVVGKDAFIAKLRELHLQCGEPSYKALADVSGELPHLYPPLPGGSSGYMTLSLTAISETLHGKSSNMPSFRWVASFVLSCQRRAAEAGVAATDPGLSSLPGWSKLWAAHTSQAVSGQAKDTAHRRPVQPGTGDSGRRVELPPGQRAFVESHRPYGSHLLDQARAGYLEAIYRLAVLLATDPAHQEDALALLIHTAAAGHAPSIDLLDSEHGQVPSAAARHAHRLAKTAKDNGSKDEALAFAQAAARGVLHTTLGFPISIYLGEESGHEQVEASVERLARSAGLTITERDDPVLGSWYRAMRARLTAVAQSPAGQDVRADLAHRAEIELARRPEAEVAAILMANVAQVIPTLHYYKDAVIRLGPVLIVKNDWALSVQQLTTRQQRILDRAPHLAAAPAEILTSLGLPEGADLP